MYVPHHLRLNLQPAAQVVVMRDAFQVLICRPLQTYWGQKTEWRPELPAQQAALLCDCKRPHCCRLCIGGVLSHHITEKCMLL